MRREDLDEDMEGFDVAEVDPEMETEAEGGSAAEPSATPPPEDEAA